jgi:hypothetical protein
LGGAIYGHADCDRIPDQLYLKGRFFWNKRTGPDLRKAMDYFQQAIDKDPNFALAYAGLDLIFIKVDPMLDPLQGEPRFQALVQKVFAPAGSNREGREPSP